MYELGFLGSRQQKTNLYHKYKNVCIITYLTCLSIQSFIVGSSLIQRIAENKESQKPEQLWASSGQSLQGATLGMNGGGNYVQLLYPGPGYISNGGYAAWATAHPWPEVGVGTLIDHPTEKITRRKGAFGFHREDGAMDTKWAKSQIRCSLCLQTNVSPWAYQVWQKILSQPVPQTLNPPFKTRLWLP